MSAIEQKALAICREYDLLSAQIVDLTKAIGGALGQCMINVNWTDGMPTDRKGYPLTHLAEALAPHETGNELSDGPRLAWLSDEEKEPILAQCGHCRMAYDHITARREAKKRLGVIKRQIRAIGRSKF